MKYYEKIYPETANEWGIRFPHVLELFLGENSNTINELEQLLNILGSKHIDWRYTIFHNKKGWYAKCRFNDINKATLLKLQWNILKD